MASIIRASGTIFYSLLYLNSRLGFNWHKAFVPSDLSNWQKTLRQYGRAASGGALAPKPPRATGVGPELPRIIASSLFPLFHFFLRSDIFPVWDRTLNSSWSPIWNRGDVRSQKKWKMVSDHYMRVTCEVRFQEKVKNGVRSQNKVEIFVRSQICDGRRPMSIFFEKTGKEAN